MIKENSISNKSIIAGFTSVDNRLMAKQDITIHQKVLLSQVVSMMNNTGRYNASNAYIRATTGLDKKTVGNAFKVFNERGWLKHILIKGGGRWVIFNAEHKANLEKYIGSVEDHKKFLKSLKKEFIINDISKTNEVDPEPEKTADGIDYDYSPISVTSSEEPEDIFQLLPKDKAVEEKIVEDNNTDIITCGSSIDKEVGSDNTLETKTSIGSVEIEVAPDNTLETNTRTGSVEIEVASDNTRETNTRTGSVAIEVASDNTPETNTRTGSVAIEVASDNTRDTNSSTVVGMERELTAEELEHINNCPIQVVYEEMNNYTRTFDNILDAVTSMKVDRPNLTPLKILMAINEGVTIEPHLHFKFTDESQMFRLNKSA